MKQEYAYWMALAHLPKMRTARKNEIIALFLKNQMNIIDFFSEEAKWTTLFLLNQDEIALIAQAKNEMASYSFLVEDLLNQGYQMIPILSPDFSTVLKKNLGYATPILLYAKGNLQLLNDPSIAIVGSRKAGELSLIFTDNVAKKASKEGKIVVSGFAKGVDKQALDSALNYNGRSIIVLPQGITTFSSGFKKYYKPIIEGNVLVVSTFFPKSPWSVEFAMSRNSIIYGLANDIFVAQSEDKGGTWSGVLDALKKERVIYIREPYLGEKSANHLLIEKGARLVSLQGELMEQQTVVEMVSEGKVEYNALDESIFYLLKQKPCTSKEIIEKLSLHDWKTVAMTKHLQQMEGVAEIAGKSPKKFCLKGGDEQLRLF